ncbi:MAG: leucine-rich repeat domain-containing protein [Clostridia bacterium]|nr:leucine-rich repeat domain-containing protein [Clostridia bacterium]
MTNNKTTKRALLGSTISLVLCFAMLLGTTFAWFTDNASSANNRIVAGNLDVDLLMDKAENGTYVSIADGNDGNIFSETGNGANWEPGKTEIVYLAVKNNGSLALKYNILLDVVDEGLVGSLKYAILDGAKAEDLKNVDSWAEIESYASVQIGDVEVCTDKRVAENGRLADGATDYFALAVHMNEQAGNDYMNGNIKIDVNVSATQVEAEEDSFGTDYDKGLVPPIDDDEVIIESEDGTQLYYDAESGALTLYSLENYEATTGEYVVPEGIEAIGNYAFSTNSDIKEVKLASTVKSLGQAFNSSAVEKVTLNEGLETIDSRAFRATNNLKEVVFSSTVKTIADNAFQKTGLTEIVIPATVEYVGETAFGASKIETVTFEGNTTIENKAFRGCANLRTIYINGNDITFVNNVNQGECWFCNSESNNANVSTFTFYVKNEAVAEKVKKALGNELDDNGSGTDPKKIKIYVNDELYLEG